ncbi:MAG: PEP-CTERM sorting domain-containing protein [Tepidisphaeraceae bacterium]
MQKSGSILAALATLAVASTSGWAATVTLNSADGFGASSFNTAGGWSNAQAPSAANDYHVSIPQLRTPADANNYTFAGNSLTLDAGGQILYKGSGAVNTYTINNLVMNGGLIRSGAGSTNLADYAGNMTVTGTGSTLLIDQSPMQIDAVVGGTGDLYVHGTQTDTTTRNATFTASNTYTGNLTFGASAGVSHMVFASTSGWTFAIGANGVNNSIVGTGAGPNNADFNGAFNLNLTNASHNAGDTWTLVGTGITPTYGATFNIPGFTQSGTTWSNGSYSFDQATGVLSAVVPEPASLGLLSLGALMTIRRRRQA